MKVLIADDDGVTRRLLASYLQKWGYEVSVASSGEEAWELFQAGNFPLVISDWVMPGVTGLELIRRIRCSPRAESVYVILLTGRAQKEDLVEGMEAGADDFVTKPFDRDELRVRLREGERIIRLEQSVAEQNKSLHEAQAALSARQHLSQLGQQAAEIIPEMARPISLVTDHLAELRRDVLAALNLLNQYRAARDLLARHEPNLTSDAAIEDENVNLASLQDNLTRLFDEAGDGLRQASALVRRLGEIAAGEETKGAGG